MRRGDGRRRACGRRCRQPCPRRRARGLRPCCLRIRHTCESRRPGSRRRQSPSCVGETRIGSSAVCDQCRGPGGISPGPRGGTRPVYGSALVDVLFKGIAWTAGIRYPERNGPVLDLPLVKEVAHGELFEGHEGFGIGLGEKRCPSVAELTDPPRLVLDFPH
ncbi:AMIN-like domain-containing (lipo)protein [Segniliparus rugosus]|uniref:AMIN-like domain-containing (lipo)protein n=1 Tax=Segniliparus rugosus TaxID=286804 RepID=UPI003CC71464